MVSTFARLFGVQNIRSTNLGLFDQVCDFVVNAEKTLKRVEW